MIISETFESLTERDPGATALIIAATGSVVSRSGLLARSREIEAELRSLALEPGDLVSIQLPNSTAFVASFLAASRMGLVSMPIDRDATAAEVGKLSEVFPIRAAVRRRGEELEIVSLQSAPSLPKARSSAVLLKLTSGSTAVPKGVLTTEENLVADFLSITQTMKIAPDDRNFGAIPFSHSYGFSNLVTPLLLQGTSIVVSNDYLPISILDLCDRFDCTVLPGIPMIFDHLSRSRRDDGGLRTVRTMISAGASLPSAVSKRFRERFGRNIHTFYGCSECGGITYDRQGAAVERGEAGSAMEGVTLRIEPRSGRMVVRSDAVAPGYLGGSPQDSVRFLSGEFLTDDIATITTTGGVRLTGRFSDLINTAGKKVNPREIEAVLLGIEGVRQAKVWGEPAGARGEVVAAAVVADPSLTRDAIRRECRGRLSAHKVPRIIKLIDALPLDERGKVKQSLLAEMESLR